MALINYKVAVTTGNKWWAGTDDDVSINIIGSRGSTQMRKLKNPYKNNFERGNTDQFEVEAILLGEFPWSMNLNVYTHDLHLIITNPR